MNRFNASLSLLDLFSSSFLAVLATAGMKTELVTAGNEDIRIALCMLMNSSFSFDTIVHFTYLRVSGYN